MPALLPSPHRSAAVALTLVLTTGATSACTMGHDASKDAGASNSAASSASTSSSESPTPSTSPSSSQASAKEVWSATQATLKKATSVEVSGSDAADGTGPSVAFSGKLDGEPSEVVFKDATMGNFTMRRLSGTVYLKGDTKYWQSVEKDDPSARGATKAANRWIAMPASRVGKGDLSKLVAKTYIGQMADPTDPKWGAIGDAGSRMTTETLDGKPTEKIVSPNGDTTVWVATDGSSHLLKVHDDAAGSDDLGQATFSRWNDTFTIPKPDDAIEGGKGTASDDGSAASPEATT